MEKFDARHSGVSPIEPNLTAMQVVTMTLAFFSYPQGIRMGGDGTLYVLDDNGIIVRSPDGTSQFILVRTGTGKMGLADDGTILTFYSSNASALNPDGTLIWSTSIPGLNPALAAPTIDGEGTIYGALDNRTSGTPGETYDPSVRNGIVAIDKNGAVKWTFDAMGLTTSIAVAEDGTILFGASNFQAPKDYLYALYPNGTMKWRLEIANHWISHQITVGSDGTAFVMENTSSLLAVDRNGTVLWSLTGLENNPTLATLNGSLIVGSERSVICIGQDGTERWNYSASSNMNDYLITEDGILTITNSGLAFLDWDGALVASATLQLTASQTEGFYRIFIGPNGETILLARFAGYYYWVQIGKAPERPGIATMELALSLLVTFTVVAFIAAAVVVLNKISLEGRKKGRTPGKLISWTSKGIKYAGVLIGIIALISIWSYANMDGNGYFIESTTSLDGIDYHILRAYSAFDDFRVFGTVAVALFALATIVSFYEWRMAFLGFFSLLFYLGDLTGRYGHGSIVWQSDLSYGLPFGDGYVLAWVSVLLLLVSGIILMYSQGDFSLLRRKKR